MQGLFLKTFGYMICKWEGDVSYSIVAILINLKLYDAVVSYQTAWLKANHPVEFMAGVMNCDLHLTDKLAVYAEEVRRGLDIEIIPPCVNRSQPTFSVSEGRIVYALGALKNVGVEAMRLIVEARGDEPFVTLYDFARRVDLKRVGKRPLEMLARAGAFDVLDRNRRRVFDSLEGLMAYSTAVNEQKNSNQVSLFGEAGDDLPEPRMSPVQDWLPAERLGEEFKAVGFYLSGHPLDDYMAPLKRKQVITLEEVEARAQGGPNGRSLFHHLVPEGHLKQRIVRQLQQTGFFGGLGNCACDASVDFGAERIGNEFIVPGERGNSTRGGDVHRSRDL